MKTTFIFNTHRLTQLVAIAVLVVLGFASCKKNDDGPEAGMPVISGVTSLQNRSTMLDKATLSNWIMIKGQRLSTTQRVTLGGLEVNMAEVHANDTSITVKVPEELPNASNNPIVVETKFGSVTFDFTIVPPPPVVSNFAPLSGSPGDIVTITGSYLDGVTSVKFGNTEAEIVSKTKTKLEVKVPAGDSNGFLTLVSAGGTTVTASAFGFKAIIYDEVFNTTFAEWNGAWGGTTADDASAEKAKRGTKSIKISYATDWEGWQFTKTAAPSLSGYSAIKLSIWAPAGSTGKVINLVVSQGWGTAKALTLTGNQWNDFTVPLSELGNPSILNHLALQNTGNGALVIYVDDIGLL
ncbi:IPT/TIG domain-containing protein [Pedobacter sp. SYSU D00535]|uniref:IPT/TIG domain-containing protein n=1 Tax=Pedobacter sp. SYSU D00535 TaxID=2810308 RepID=UPI001A9742C3|nr:IPT/TIG domain-containing protein [Pedobacter sp. SYSU D00535]